MGVVVGVVGEEAALLVVVAVAALAADGLAEDGGAGGGGSGEEGQGAGPEPVGVAVLATVGGEADVAGGGADFLDGAEIGRASCRERVFAVV